MCGRYSLFAPPADIEARFDAAFAFDFEPRYNAAPSQSLPVITGDEPDTIQRMEWGLVPSFADEKKNHGYINARAETLSEKRSFADAYESRRCLVPADGMYEWVERESGKQPYRVALPDDDLFAMAGLYERWTPPQRQTGLGEFTTDSESDGQDEIVETFTVVTTAPNDTVADLHHRMAVVLAPDEESTWLTGDTDTAAGLLDPYDGPMRTYPISTAVNSPSNDSPAIIEEVDV
ncbi:SOS response-associated peptidase [Haloarcula onubensis]|uniref:SOS response-associated peptidase n=1 Tax=Haloarcula onubensis TaxID=2950539 RepID=A0ABU2FSA9_9EURY|nr:SOS response-associated peptidase [Halomicroarcula sp. S3CR25-11]MDS0283041.1 SOS response-associated peptidase [Halomicroarcula sp. S3CR25-11]